ncbi:MAG TPA: acyl-CoA dehydrogenase family protein [Acidimicrobiales bacterium]|nr:acyl-CoA dehydrogenase family protein [Acidimicrobiales bacterium]
MEFGWDPALDKLRREAEEVALRAAADLPVKEDSWINGYDRDFSRELGERGWLGMTWPKEYGGHERTALERFVVTEALIENGAPIAASWFADRQMGPSILAFGTDEQKRRYLPPMTRGESNWCIGMSEPDNGSDLAHLTTRAVPDGDSFVVTGRKVWTSFAATADYCYLICRTDADAPAHKGLSELIVPMDSPGVEVLPITDMTTNRHFCEVVLDEVRVPAANLVGELNGSWRQTMRQLEHERGGIDRLVSNKALYRDARPHADTTDPRVRQEIAAIESSYRIGRLMVLKGVLGQGLPGMSAITKTFGTEFEQRVADFVGRTLGAEAMLWGRWARGICYGPAYTIMGGTSNVLRNIVGERVLGLPREPA